MHTLANECVVTAEECKHQPQPKSNWSTSDPNRRHLKRYKESGTVNLKSIFLQRYGPRHNGDDAHSRHRCLGFSLHSGTDC